MKYGQIMMELELYACCMNMIMTIGEKGYELNNDCHCEIDALQF